MELEMLSRPNSKRYEEYLAFSHLIVCIQKFGHLGLQFAKGGQISIDCFPTGLQYMLKSSFFWKQAGTKHSAFNMWPRMVMRKSTFLGTKLCQGAMTTRYLKIHERYISFSSISVRQSLHSGWPHRNWTRRHCSTTETIACNQLSEQLDYKPQVKTGEVKCLYLRLQILSFSEKRVIFWALMYCAVCSFKMIEI